MIVLNLAASGLSVPCELGRPDTGYKHVDVKRSNSSQHSSDSEETGGKISYI